MARKTIRDRLIDALIAKGSSIVENARTRRYTVLTRYDGRPGYLYVGRSGALRVGRTVSESRGIPEFVKARLLAHTKGRSGAA